MGALQTLFAHAVRMQAVTLALSLAAVLLCTSASPLKTEAHFNTDVFTADNTHVTQNSVETAEPAAPKFDTSVFSAAEWTEDAAPVETIPLRRYSSGSGTAGSGVAPSPPATPPPAKKFTQPITVPLTAAQYTGAQKTVYERGYGFALGIFDTTTNTYKTGCSVSSAVKSRRAVKVEFTATAAGAYAAAAETQTAAIAATPATFAQAVATAKTADTALANVTVPAADGSDLTVEAAKVEVISSGASSIAASGCLAVGLAILALRH